MSHVFIIAEAGVNHNGDISIAKRLIDKAKQSGADAVKFQTGTPALIVASWAKKADYQKNTTGSDQSQLDMIKGLMLPHEDFAELKSYATQVGIEFFSTAFDIPSLDYLLKIGMDIVKIPSGEITNLPYLRQIGKFSQQRKLILSTGMATVEEIDAAVKALENAGQDRKYLHILHCNTEYPTPLEDVNLRAMQFLGKRYAIPFGYSDHTEGIVTAIAAVALGATIIEKHFTLSRDMKGPDHKASLEPAELESLVKCIRDTELVMSGSGLKVPSPSESKNIEVARRSIVASIEIRIGEILSEKNITTKRPGTGISPMEWDRVIGTRAKRNFEPDALIEI